MNFWSGITCGIVCLLMCVSSATRKRITRGMKVFALFMLMLSLSFFSEVFFTPASYAIDSLSVMAFYWVMLGHYEAKRVFNYLQGVWLAGLVYTTLCIILHYAIGISPFVSRMMLIPMAIACIVVVLINAKNSHASEVIIFLAYIMGDVFFMLFDELFKTGFLDIFSTVMACVIYLFVYLPWEREKERRYANQISAAAIEEAVAEKTLFLSDISYNARMQLDAISGLSALARAHIDDREKVSEYLGKISAAGDNLVKLLDNATGSVREGELPGVVKLPGQEKSFDPKGKKVLVVEDNELNREIAQELLEDEGFIVDAVEDGDVAVERMRSASREDYDLILMDIQMNRMNGLDATRAIRSLDNAWAARIPIIAMSANAFEEDVRHSLSAGMNAHIAKPLDVGVLLEKIIEVYSSF